MSVLRYSCVVRVRRLPGGLSSIAFPAYLLLVLLALPLGGCGKDSDISNGSGPTGLRLPRLDTSLTRIKSRGEIVFLTRNSPTTYYEGRDGLAGLEHDMAQAFATHLEVRARFEIRDSLSDILDALKNNEGDVAAAGLSVTRGRTGEYLFGPSYQAIQQKVVCRRGGAAPRSVADLDGLDVLIASDSSYVERLVGLQAEYPELSWRETDEMTTEEILAMVWDKKVDCTVADSNIVAINRRYHPELDVRFDLGKPESQAWAMQPDARVLKGVVEKWFSGYQERGDLDQLIERYYGHIEVFDYVDTRRFVHRMKKRLPKYRRLFEKAAAKYGWDWTLLAAMSYQESHWNPRAKSPTGVRGIMMLTLPTAREVGVKSRLDPAQSIEGGAKYLARMRKRFDAEITEPDRTWLTLAAYNIGMGHIHDAQGLARKLGKNPHLWSDMAEVLPLLAQKKYYRKLRHGYARGYEPVTYVKRIRDFQDILEQQLRSVVRTPSAGSPG
ncbi:MAG: membrane-bound lytic murein transglycosylase MltF [Pseudomonadota bacterium]|nr:MAG: membrane-bound lytic murein transglycosylase MltF [Pseudomonadota bacterium]